MESETISADELVSGPLWKRLIRCNPFYLISALLLIFGAYRVSVDPQFLSTETRQVLFNFSSIHLYSLMLVITAVFLSRCKIWYDATLLVFLENVLVLVPFILISHAVVLDSSLAWTMSLLGFVLVAAKFSSFKGFFAGLNFPKELLFLGVFILAVNAAVPIIFRKALDIHNDLWTVRSQYCWFLLLPLLTVAGNILPPLRAVRTSFEEHRKDWIPLTSFLLWIAGTATHFYSVGYVDDQKFELSRFSVLAWAIAWLLCAKITLLVSRFTPCAPEIMLSLPVATAFLAFDRPILAIALSLLNAGIFAILCLRWRAPGLAAVLGGVSILVALFFVPSEWVQPLVSGYSKAALMFGLMNAALIAAAIRMRTAKAAWIGAICVASLFIALKQTLPYSEHYAVQAACSFLLIHSLFWRGRQDRGSHFSLVLAAAIWAVDSVAVRSTGSLPLEMLPYLGGVVLLLLAFFVRKAPLQMICAAAMLLAVPALEIGFLIQKAPTGLLALAASFLLFGFGTAFAIWKSRFSRSS